MRHLHPMKTYKYRKMNISLRKSLFAIALFSFVGAFAQGPNNSGTYYSAADGKKGKALKTALSKIIGNPDVVSYKALPEAYKKTDRRDDGKVWDMYSCTTNYNFSDNTGNYKKEGDMYNREHSFPKSWFGGKVKPMYCDIVHVVPCDGYVNNRRGNDPFGETDGDVYKSNKNFSKYGKSKTPGYTGNVFEPNDIYKGDFARIYLYMATCYESKISGWSSPMLAGNSYPAYKEWALNLLLKWAEQDPVSEKEVNRNTAAYGVQKNRNPFVDYPGLERYIWGDMQNVPFSYDNYQNPTSIITVNAPTTPRPVRIYTISGTLVRTTNDADRALDGLNKGIYIVNGKKYVVQ